MSTQEEVVKREIARELERLPPLSRQRVVRKLIESETKKLAISESKRIALKDELQATEAMVAWADDDAELVLEKNDCSRLHIAKAAALAGKFHIYDGNREKLPDGAGATFLSLRHTFVVKHNWAAAFEGAQDFDGEVKLPFEFCAFEFRINGKSVIAVCVDDVQKLFPDKPMMVLFESLGHWFFLDVGKEMYDFVWSQIRAITIALDAEVATHEVVRAPAKLNEKRKKQGRVELSDYHVVDLSRRHRIAGPGTSEGSRKRLHFRRGHWRHYETHNTWIRWCLVGDPNLGFVAKEYVL